MEKLVYKYYSPSEYNLDALFNHYLWFSKKELLNDPFDLLEMKSRVPLKESITAENMSLYTMTRFIFHIFKSDVTFWNTCKNRFFENYKDIQDINDLKDGRDLTILLSKEISYMAHYIIGNTNKFGSCSFTDSDTNLLMWAHYTNNYSGWCIAYKEQLLQENYTLLPTTYLHKELTPIHHKLQFAQFQQQLQKTQREIHLNMDDLITLYLLHVKYHIWKYEKEKRIILIDEAQNGFARNFNIEAIDHIVVGKKINPSYKQLLQNFANQNSIRIHELEYNKPFKLTLK